MGALKGSGAGTRSNASPMVTFPIPNAAGGLTTKSGAAATLAVGDYVLAAVAVNTATAPTAYPTALSSGTPITKILDVAGTNSRLIVWGWTVASADLSGTVTISATLGTGNQAAYSAQCSAYTNISGAEVVATSGATAPQTGSGSPPTFPGQGAPPQTGDTLVWLMTNKQAGGSYTFGTSGGTPAGLYAGATPAVEGVRGIQGTSAVNPGVALSAADLAATLGTTAQSALTGVVVPTARTDNATAMLGQPVITDSAVVATDQGRGVTGTGIPANTFVGTVTPGTSFRLSSSSSSQVDVNATAVVTSVTIGIAQPWITAALALVPVAVPTVTTGSPVTGVCGGTSTLSAAGVAGSGRTIDHYVWTVPSGCFLTNATTASPTIRWPNRSSAGSAYGAGPYFAQVQSVDNTGAMSVAATQQLAWNAAAPALSAALSAATVDTGQNETITGSFSDPQSQTITLTVTADAGSPAGTLTFPTASSFQYVIAETIAGNYGYTVTATNQDGVVTSQHVAHTVVAGPVAMLTTPASTVNVQGQAAALTLDASGSTGSGLTYLLTATGPGAATITGKGSKSPTVTFPANLGGTYTLTETVTDGQGVTVSTSLQVTAQVQVAYVRLPDGSYTKAQIFVRS